MALVCGVCSINSCQFVKNEESFLPILVSFFHTSVRVHGLDYKPKIRGLSSLGGLERMVFATTVILPTCKLPPLKPTCVILPNK